MPDPASVYHAGLPCSRSRGDRGHCLRRTLESMYLLPLFQNYLAALTHLFMLPPATRTNMISHWDLLNFSPFLGAFINKATEILAYMIS